MSELKNTSSLPAEVQSIFIPFLSRLIKAIEEDILSVFIYGSASGENFIPKVSDINSAIVLRTAGLELLEKILKITMTIHNKRIIAPLVLTKQHISSSLDVFPIEFLEMKDNYVVLFGEDPLESIVVETHHARLFCEQQLKGKLIRIRQGYLESRDKKSVIEILLKDSLNTLIPVFRTILRLKSIKPPVDKGEVLNVMGKTFDVKTDAMALIWKDKKNDETISGRDVKDVFGRYIQELEDLASKVDQL